MSIALREQIRTREQYGLNSLINYIKEVSPSVLNQSINFAGHSGHNGNILFYQHFTYVSTIEYLISQGADVNFKNEDGKTPLFFHEDPDIVNLLISHGANVNEQDNRGNIPLFHVNNIEAAELLLENGADINHCNQFGENATFYISDPFVMQYLIDQGLNINQITKSRVNAFFKWNVEGNNNNLLLLLIRNGLEINMYNQNLSGDSLFSTQITRMSKTILKEMIKKNVDIYAENNECKTFLINLSPDSAENFFYLLKEKKLDLTHKKSNGQCVIEDISYFDLWENVITGKMLSNEQLLSSIGEKTLGEYIVEKMKNNEIKAEINSLIEKEKLNKIIDISPYKESILKRM